MARRLIDLLLAALGLALVAPALLAAMLLVWAEDGGAPLYRGLRVGRGGRDFGMLKLRTMAVGAERAGGTSTARSDPRLTRLGRFLRRWKIDELPQLWNVLAGEMSLVGPRPNMRRGGVDRYTAAERRLLEVRPGLTDLASIVFADEGDILDGSDDPDDLYDRIIRPWKSRLALLYVANRSSRLDLEIVWLTMVAMLSRPAALAGVARIAARLGADSRLVGVCRRSTPLSPAAPPINLPSEVAECGSIC